MSSSAGEGLSQLWNTALKCSKPTMIEPVSGGLETVSHSQLWLVSILKNSQRSDDRGDHVGETINGQGLP